MKTTLPPLFELYRSLIATPSISAFDPSLDQSNQQVIQLLAQWLETLDMQVIVNKIPTTNKYNLLAKSAEGNGGLLLCGHTDTVPFDEGRWQHDPFKLTEQGNKWYGLGTADMKGFFASVIDTLRDIELKKLRKPLYILATADEETTMAGARYFTEHTLIHPDCAIIGEPTDLKPIYAHKGHIANVIRIIGQSGHSSDPDQGINAIEIMHQAIHQLLLLRDTLKTRFANQAFAVPYPTMNLGHIHGGDAANRICACCELHLDIRPMPELSLDAMQILIEEALKPIQQRWPDRLSIQPLHEPIPGYQCPKQHPFVQQIESATAQIAEAVNYCTEAPFIQQLCPTLILGPGSINQAHQPDEFITMDTLQPTKNLFSQLIRSFCIHA